MFSSKDYKLRSRGTVLSMLNIQARYDMNVVGQMLFQWGMDRADALGVEFWACSDEVDAELYRANSMKAASAAASFSVFWGVRRRAVDSRERYKSSYLDTKGFW